jgi:hypothetical protein
MSWKCVLRHKPMRQSQLCELQVCCVTVGVELGEHDYDSEKVSSCSEYPPMSITEFTANAVRARIAAEIAMASVNAGNWVITRRHAERLLDDYFSLVEQAVPSNGANPLDRRS